MFHNKNYFYKTFFSRLLLCLLFIFIFLFTYLNFFKTNAFATINETFNFQGKLTNTNGTNVSDGTYNFRFSIYDASTSGNCLWTSKGTIPGTGACTFAAGSPGTDLVAVTVTNGLFYTDLGTTTGGLRSFEDGSALLAKFNNSGLYLQIDVYNGSSWESFSSRKLLQGVPYAFRAKYADTATNLALSGLTAATATNSIDNLNYAQTWAWSTADDEIPFTYTANALSTGTGFVYSTSSTALTTGGLLSISGTGAPASSWSGDLAKIEYNNADTDVDGNALKVGILGAGAGEGSTLNVTTGQTGTNAYAFRVNDDGTYTDSSPFVIDKDGNVGIGIATSLYGKFDLRGGNAYYSFTDCNSTSGIFIKKESTGTSYGYIGTCGSGLYLSDNGGGGGVVSNANLTINGTLKRGGGSAETLLITSQSGGGALIQGVATNASTLIVRGVSSQTSNLIVWQNSTPTSLGLIDINGNLGLGDLTPASPLTVGNGDLFQVNSSGDLIKINNVTYTWPGSQGGVNTYLKNNGSGTLTWDIVSASASLGALSAAAQINSIDNLNYAQTWAWSTADDEIPFTYTANALSTGTGFVYSTSSTALTTGGLLSISGTGAPGTSWTGNLAKIEYNNADTDVDGNALKVGILGAGAGEGTALNVTTEQTGTNAYALRVNDDGTYTDSTPFIIDKSGNVSVGSTTLTSLFNVGSSAQFQIDSSGNVIQAAGATTGSAYSLTGNSVTSGSLLALSGNSLTIGTGLDLNVSSTYVTAGSFYGNKLTFSDTGNVTTGTDYSYGQRIDFTRTGASAGGAIYSYGQYISATGDSNTDFLTGLDVTTNAGGSGTAINALATSTSAGSYLAGAIFNAKAHTGSSISGYVSGSWATAETTTVNSVPTMYGIGSDVVIANSSVTNAYGVYTGVYNSSGTLSTGYSIYVATATNGGTFTNNYGLYIQDQSGVGSTKSYNFYSVGGTAKNYFAGLVGIGDETPASALTVGNNDLFQVDSTGNIVKINNVTYSWPASQGGVNTYLKNNGSGTLTWDTVSASASLGTLTAAGQINSIDNLNYAQTWAWSTADDEIPFTYTANALSTGTGFVYSTSSTALTTGGLLSISGTGAPAASWSGDLAKIEYNNVDVDVDGNALKVGILGAGAGEGTALNVTTAQTGTNAYAFRVNDDGTYTDSSPFVVNKDGNVGVGTASITYQFHLKNAETGTGQPSNLGIILEDSQGGTPRRGGFFFGGGDDFVLGSSTNKNLNLVQNDGFGHCMTMATTGVLAYQQGTCTIGGNTRFYIASGGNTAIGSTTATSLFNVGSSDELQIDTSGTLSTSGNISTSGSGTITSAALLTASNGFTMSTGALSLTATSGSISLTGFGSSSITSTNTTQSTTSSILALIGNSLNTGSAFYAASSTLTAGSLVDLAVSGTGANSNTQKALNISTSGANLNSTQTTYGSYITNTHSGTASTNIAGYFNSTNAVNSFGIDIGSVEGTTTSTGIRIGTLSGGASSSNIYGINITGVAAGQSGSAYGLNIGNSSGGAFVYQINTGNLTGIASETDTLGQLKLGTVTLPSTIGTFTGFGIQTGAISGGRTGTNTYGLNLGANSATGTAAYGINIGAISGTATTNIGLNIGAVSGGGANYSIITNGGNVGIGETTPASLLTVGTGDLFQVDSSGNIVKINNVTYSWPGTQGGSNTYLKNNGSGTLTWDTVSASASLGTLTAAGQINSIDNLNYAQTWAWSTADDEIPFTYTANALSTGTGFVYSTSSTALTTGGLLSISGTGAPGTSWTGNLAKIEYNNADTDVDGNALKVGILGAGAGEGTALNITTEQTGTNAYALRVNDDGTYTDSSPFIIDKSGNVTVGSTTLTSLFNVGSTAQLQINTSGTLSTSGNISTTGSGTMTSAGLLTATSGIVSNSHVLIGAQSDSASTGSSTYSLLNSTPGTFVSSTDVNMDKISGSAIYKGKLFVATAETDSAAVYRYDGGTTWVRVTSTTLGRTLSGETTVVDGYAMTVFDGKLWIGSQTGASNLAAVYYSTNADTASAGDNFTMVNSARGTINAGTQAGIQSMTVFGGNLIVATQKTDSAEIVRYEGGTTFTRINPTVGKSNAETTADKDAFNLVVCNNVLFSGSISGAATGIVASYNGSGTTWLHLTGTTGGGAFGAETSTSDIDSLACYNGSLYITASKTAGNAAAIYYYKATVPVANVAANFVRINVAVGKMLNADSAIIDKFILQTYNGRLYAGSQTATGDGVGALFEYSGIPLADWTLMSAGARGTFGSETNVDNISELMDYDGTLYVGTDDLTAGIGSVYTWSKTAENSFALKFNSGSSNYGALSFVGDSQATANSSHYGSFVFSNSVKLTAAAFDYAEDYPTLDSTLTEGEIVSIDERYSEHIKRASIGDSVVGIVSTNPGFRLSSSAKPADGARWVPIALVGRVPVKVTTKNGNISIGDNLTLSNIPGVAMKAVESGMIIGQALSSYSGESVGEVTIFIKNTYTILSTNSILTNDFTNTQDLLNFNLMDQLLADPTNTNTMVKVIQQQNSMISDIEEKINDNDNLKYVLDVDEKVSKGDILSIVSIDNSVVTVKKTTLENDPKMFGVSQVSIDTNDTNRIMKIVYHGLTRVNTNNLDDIEIGDYITSNQDGKATKAISAGNVLGRVVEKKLDPVSVTINISPTYYTPKPILSENITTQNTNLEDVMTNNNVVQLTGEFNTTEINNLKLLSSLITIKDAGNIQLNGNLSVDNIITTKLIAKENSDLITQLADSSGKYNFLIVNKDGKELFKLDSSGNAKLAGNLTISKDLIVDGKILGKGTFESDWIKILKKSETNIQHKLNDIPNNINVVKAEVIDCKDENGKIVCENITNLGFGSMEGYYYKNLDKDKIIIVNSYENDIYVKVNLQK